MDEYFIRTTIAEIAKNSSHRCVMFFGRVLRLGTCSSNLVVVEDCNSGVVVDFADLDSIQVEKGEYYRFCGNVVTPASIDGTSKPRVLLHMVPVRCDGYDTELYERSLLAKRSFLAGFDALMAFGLKNP